MNNSPTTNRALALPFQLEYCSAKYHFRGRVHAGLDVWQIRAALVGHHDCEHTNVLAVKLTTQGLIAVEFELVEDDRPDRTTGYRPRGITIGELRAFFADPLLASCERTNVVDVIDLGMDNLFFVPAAADAAREYRIEGGNSNTGDIGYVAYIRARSQKAARELFESVSINENPEALTYKADGMEICIYINPTRMVVERVE